MTRPNQFTASYSRYYLKFAENIFNGPIYFQFICIRQSVCMYDYLKIYSKFITKHQYNMLHYLSIIMFTSFCIKKLL